MTRFKFHTGFPSAVALVAAAILTTGLGGCETPIEAHGYLPDEEAIGQLEPGTHGRQDVQNLLGSPSSISTFSDDTWYYIGKKQTQFAFFEPDVQERKVLVLSFDGNDRLSDKEVLTLANSRSINPVDRVTPTEGRDLTILQQLLGNIGRFNESPSTRVNPTGRGGGGLP